MADVDYALLQGMAFGWEAVMTFLLVAVVYAVAIGKPSFVETGPLAVGFTLWASAFVGRAASCNVGCLCTCSQCGLSLWASS